MKLPPLYLLHPAVVHFPIALLIVGWVAGVMGRRREAAAQASSWLLWVGTLSAWAAMGLGLLAAKTAPHVPPAWETVNLHRTLGYWTVGLFTGLSLWRWRLGRKYETLFLALWLAACGVLLATGYEGGELVFTFSMGVSSD